MSRVLYLIKVGELTLKRGNIKDYEQRLVQNALLFLEGTNSRVRLRAGRMYIEGPEKAQPSILFALKHLVGITGWARAVIVEPVLENIKTAVVAEALSAREAGYKTFKVECRRADKRFPHTSYELVAECGACVSMQGILAVDVHNPDLTITVEIREKTFVYGHTTQGRRGLPCGTGGRGLLLLSGGIDSPVAGYRMIRRGMKIDCIYFHSHPYTSPEAKGKVEDLAKLLARFGLGTHLNIVPFTKIQEHIRNTAPQEYSTILARMAMMHIANLLCQKIGSQCIITGESISQVASQTIENVSVIDAEAQWPVLRPLCGLDKQEIIDTAKEIGTYGISILPYKDCCVLFSPQHPILRAKPEQTKALYNSLNIEDLINSAFKQLEHYRYGWNEGLINTAQS